jgi:lipoate synthase
MAADLVCLWVGGDRFAAQVVAEACRSFGIRVELLTADDSGVDPVLGIIQGHRLLVTADDAERVRAILKRVRGSAP